MKDSLNEVAYMIAFLKGDPDNRELMEAVKVHALGFRSLYLRQDSSRNITSSLFIKRLSNLKLKRVHITGNDKLASLSKNTVLVTEQKIPAPVRIKGDLFFYVGDVNNTNPYTEADFNDLAFIAHNRFTAKIPRYIHIDNEIYIINANVSHISIHMVPDDLRELNRISGCGCPFDEDNDPFFESQDIKLFVLTELSKAYNVQAITDNREINANKP